jgi:hypothetical protein
LLNIFYFYLKKDGWATLAFNVEMGLNLPRSDEVAPTVLVIYFSKLSSNHKPIQQIQTPDCQYIKSFSFPPFQAFCKTFDFQPIFVAQHKSTIMQEQNFKNHGRMVKGFHFVLFGLLLVTLVSSLINLYQEAQAGEDLLEALMFVLLVVSVTLTAWYARVFALKAQDRAIRAEENFRHYILTGKAQDSGLSINQIIALRFASDAEFVALSQRALAENLGSKAIKTLIQNWKADHNRA